LIDVLYTILKVVFIHKKQDTILRILIAKLINNTALIKPSKFPQTIEHIGAGAFKNQIIQLMMNLLNPANSFAAILFEPQNIICYALLFG
jgi:hypothetical protein